MRYEYIRIYFDWNDLKDMNSLGQAGWKVISVQQRENSAVALLMRELDELHRG